MRFRLLKDILVYIVVPLLLFNTTIMNNVQVSFRIVFLIAIIYSIYTKIKENRLNTTGLILFTILIIYFLSNKSLDSDNIYFYNTCIFLSIGLIIPGLRVFNKDISIIVIKDILKSLNKNSLAMIRLLKKKSMMQEINKITSLIETNLILVALLRIFNIIVYGGSINSYLNFITNCIGVVFSVIIVYKIIKVVYESKKLNINKESIGPSREDNTKGKVINFNYYK
ncbi:hypothetical protein [Terrisporobacter sp.]